MNERRAGERRCSKCREYSDETVRRRGIVLCPSCLREVAAPRYGYRPPSIWGTVAEVMAMTLGGSQSQKDVHRRPRL